MSFCLKLTRCFACLTPSVGRTLLLTMAGWALLSQAPVYAQFSAKTILEPLVETYDANKYQDVDKAISELQSNRLTDARASLATARQKNPELPPANIMLAQILFRLNQAAAGQAALEEAVKEDAADPAAYVYLGEIALQSRRRAEAELCFNKAIELSAGYTANDKRKNRLLINAYGGLATIAESDNRLTDAGRLLQEVLKLDKENTLAMTRIGRILFLTAKGKEDEDKAYKIFQQLHRIDSENTANPEVNMALLYEGADRRDNAKRMMELAAQKDANNPRTRLAVAKWAVEAQDMEMAKANAEAAYQADPNLLEAKLYLGLIARFNNDLTTAEEMFKAAHFQSPGQLGAVTQLALVLIDQPDEAKRNQALEYAQLNTRLNNNLNELAGREAAVTLAWVLYRLKQDASALRALQQALSAGGIGADNAYHAAQILYDSGQTDAAKRLLEPALASESVFPNRSAAQQLLNKINRP